MSYNKCESFMKSFLGKNLQALDEDAAMSFEE
jgi:hypothetical protein